jgi:hypothetical protein
MAQSKNSPARIVSKTTPAKVATKAVGKTVAKKVAMETAKKAGSSVLKKVAKKYLGPVAAVGIGAYELYDRYNKDQAKKKKADAAKKNKPKVGGNTPIVKTPEKTPAKPKTDPNKPNVIKKAIDRANEYPSKAPAKKTPIKEKSWDDYRKSQTPADAPKMKNPPKVVQDTVKKAPAGKTVSQVWKEKTGMDWSEAKKLGVSDGSAKSNMALLAKLNSGATSRADLGVKTEPITMAPKKAEAIKTASPELATKRKGGMTKMRTGGMVNSNAKITAIKRATGTVGGTSTAPKKASPTKLGKAKMGGSKGKSC